MKRLLGVFMVVFLFGATVVLPETVWAAPTLANTLLPEATVSQVYSYQFQGVNGTAPYTFQKLSTTYPGSEITVSSSGIISGTPQHAGTWEFNIRVTDSASALGTTGILVFKVNGTTALPVVTISQDNSVSTSVAVKSGQTDVGLLAFKVSATNADAYIYGFTLSAIYPPDISAKLSNLRAQYGSTVLGLASSNATDFYFTFPLPVLIAKDASLIVKVLANIMSDVGGTIQPKIIGYSIKNAASVQVTPATSEVASMVSIQSAGGTLAITSPEILPDGTVNQQYAYAFQASGGTAPYTWRIAPGGSHVIYPCCYVGLQASGSLVSPAGASGQQMPFSGTYKIGVRVTDAKGATSDKVFQYTIKPESQIAGQVNEGYVDLVDVNQISGWVFRSKSNDSLVPVSILVVFEKVSNPSETYSLSFTPSLARSDVGDYLRLRHGISKINVPVGFSSNPQSVLISNGAYRIKSAQYDGISLVLSDSAKRQFTVGASVVPPITSGYVKVADDPTVYWISPWGGKMPVLSEKIFLSYGARWNEVRIISQEELDSYEDILYIKLRGNARVYKLEDSIKRYLTPAVSTRLNIDPASVVEVNTTEFYTYRTGSTIQ